jgi:hypothetical protein
MRSEVAAKGGKGDQRHISNMVKTSAKVKPTGFLTAWLACEARWRLREEGEQRHISNMVKTNAKVKPTPANRALELRCPRSYSEPRGDSIIRFADGVKAECEAEIAKRAEFLRSLLPECVVCNEKIDRKVENVFRFGCTDKHNIHLSCAEKMLKAASEQSPKPECLKCPQCRTEKLVQHSRICVGCHRFFPPTMKLRARCGHWVCGSCHQAPNNEACNWCGASRRCGTIGLDLGGLRFEVKGDGKFDRQAWRYSALRLSCLGPVNIETMSAHQVKTVRKFMYIFNISDKDRADIIISAQGRLGMLEDYGLERAPGCELIYKHFVCPLDEK